MLWLVTAAVGDAPTAIIACVALVLGVVLAARGRRGEPAVERAAPPPADPPAAPLVVPAAAPAGAPAPAVGHGAIRFVTNDDVPPEPQPEPPEPQPEPPEPPEPPPPPPPPAVPQVPPTTFRQGSIRVGGIDRRRD